MSARSHAAVPAGERIQLHRMGDKFQYWSRNNKEHGVQSAYDVMKGVAALQIKPQSCILDGEFIVWNKSRSGPKLPLLWACSPAQSTAVNSEPAKLAAKRSPVHGHRVQAEQLGPAT